MIFVGDSSSKAKYLDTIFTQAVKQVFEKQKNELTRSAYFVKVDAEDEEDRNFLKKYVPEKEWRDWPNIASLRMGTQSLSFVDFKTNDELDVEDALPEVPVDDSTRLEREIAARTEIHFSPLSCMDIGEENTKPQFVFFGNHTDLNPDGRFNYLTSVAIRDKYQFKEASGEEITFHYNDDAECREARGLPVDRATFVLYVTKDAPPFVLEEGSASPELFEKERVLHWISLSIAETHMKWSGRAL